MTTSRQSLWWLAAGAGLVIVAGAGFAAGRTTGQATSAVTPRPSPDTPPAGSPSSTTKSGSVPSGGSSTSDSGKGTIPVPGLPPTASITGSAGQSVLAASGSGVATNRFIPAAQVWALHVSYACPEDSSFSLAIQAADGSEVDRVTGSGSGEDRRSISSRGAVNLLTGGSCRWALEASG